MACVPDDAIDRFSELTTGEERLYTRLCRYVCRDEMSKDYGLAWPSRSTLAGLMNCTETHISDLITELSRRGWVSKIGWKYRLLVGDFLLNSQIIPTIQPRKSRNKSTKSESNSRNIPTLSDSEAVQLSESDLPIVGIWDANSRNLGVQLSEFEPTVRKNQNEPVIEPEEPIKEIHVELIPVPDDIQVFEFWKVHMKHPRSQLDVKRQKNVKARLKDGYSVEDLCNAVRGCKLSAFHMGDNKQGKKFDDLELICRDGPKVDGFIATFEEPPIQTANGANGNGQNAAAKSKFAADSEQRAESTVRSLGYFDRRVAAVNSVPDSTTALVKRTPDFTGAD